MLPRLIVAAIAVNVSFYICQLMVDISNVLGYELMNFLVELARGVTDRSAMPIQSGVIDNQTSGGTLGAIALGVLATGAVLAILPMLLSTIVTIAVVGMLIALILLLRKAIIVLLVVASPIAFVAYILPNTEKFYQKWLSMFWKLLLVFPVVGLLMGGGQLASAIVLAAGTTTATVADNPNTTENESTTRKSVYADASEKCIQLPLNSPAADSSNAGAEVRPCGDGSTPFLLGLSAAAIAVAPLIAVWGVLKGALAAAGAIGGAIQTYGNRFNGNARNRAKKAEGALRGAAGQGIATNALKGGFGRQTAGFARRRQLSKGRREARLEAAQAGFGLADAGAQGIIQDTLNAKKGAALAGAQQTKLSNAPGGVGLAAGTLGAGKLDNMGTLQAAEVVKAMKEAVEAAEFTIDPSNLDVVGKQLESAITAKDEVMQRALSNVLLRAGNKGMGTFQKHIQSAESSGSDTSKIRTNVVNNHPSVRDGDKSIGEWASKGGSLASHQSSAATWTGITAAKFASMTGQAQVAAANALTPAELTRIADDLKQTPETLIKVDGAARTKLGL